MQISPHPVTPAQLDELTSTLRRSARNPLAGIFDPQSVSWRVNRESTLFLAAGRASLLQLAHPWVAAAIDHHSNLRSDPLARFHHTFRIIFAMAFGSLDQAIAASAYLYKRHTAIRGDLSHSINGWPLGTRYFANELHALTWVFATLVQSAVLAYEAILPPLSPDDRQSYYQEWKLLATLFGIPPHSLPADWNALQQYIHDTIQSPSIQVDPLARELAHLVLHPSATWLPVPHWYRALTALWLPEKLRCDFALPSGTQHDEAARRALRHIRALYPKFPAPIRFVGPYREAMARIQGRNPGLLIQASNRFWTGNSHILFRAAIR